MAAPSDPTSTVTSTATTVQAMREQLATLADDLGNDLDDAARIDALRALEELKSGAAAAQARLTAAFAASQRSAQAAAGVPARRRARGLGAQIGLARRESPHRGQRHLALAGVLVHQMPHTLAAMTRGQLTEDQATHLAHASTHLTPEQRADLDEALCAQPTHLEDLLKTGGDHALIDAAHRHAHHLDPTTAATRAARAAHDRRVTSRPMPHSMTQITALLPAAQGIAVHTALSRAAKSLRTQGDPRTHDQAMADTLVERLTGQSSAEAVPVAVTLVMGHHTLLHHSLHGHSDAPAYLPGYGHLPAPTARELLHHATDAGNATLRRLFTHPTTKQIVAMDSTARYFPTALAHLIKTRDAHTCRTPYCGAPIRHLDHVIAAEDGGPTNEANGQGLCESCNHTKQAPGWHAEPRPGPTHTVVTTTPTGHTYHSTAPPLTGATIRIRLDYTPAA